MVARLRTALVVVLAVVVIELFLAWAKWEILPGVRPDRVEVTEVEVPATGKVVPCVLYENNVDCDWGTNLADVGG